MIISMLAAALLLPQFSADPCPADVISMWIKGRGYGLYNNNHVELKLRNKGDKTIESVAFQFDAYDSERRVFVSRYYLMVGCCYKAGYPGKSIGPDETKTLWGGVTPRIALLYGGYPADGTNIKINVIYYKDGSKWERENWRKENPN